MPTFRDFEIEAIRLLTDGVLSPDQLALLAEYSDTVEYDYTGSGYFLTLEKEWLPKVEGTYSEPAVVGNYENIQSGFVVFLRKNELTLECHTWGEIDVPENYRDKPVKISTPQINAVILE
jgi:hypothetical protein